MKLKWKVFKTKTEASLWLLFFLVAAGFGFLQGWHPEINLSRFMSAPPVIEIMSISPVFFPAEIVAELEKQTGTKIKISQIQNWEDLRVKLIADSSVNLLFLPASWVQALRQENLLRNGSRLENMATDLLSADFNLNASSAKQDFLPLYWGRLAFFSQGSTPKSVGLPEDSDTVTQIFESLHLQKQESLFSKVKFQFFPMEQWPSAEDPKIDLVLAPHLWGGRHPQWKENPAWPQLLAIWGFALPKNSHLNSKIDSLVRAYTQASVQAQILEKLPLASTLSVMDERAGPLEQKALYIRDLGLLKMNLIHQHEAAHSEQAQVFSSLNFTR